MKRIALWLALAMLMTCMAGIGQAAAVDPATLKPYELVWYTLGSEAEDHQLVTDEINKILTERFNATIKMIPNSNSEHRTKLQLITAAMEPFDLCFVDTQYADYVAKEAFYPLTDLLAEYGQDMMATYPQNLWDSVTINGEIYAVPTHKYSCQHMLYNIDLDAAEAAGVDATKVVDWESFLAYLREMKAAGGDRNGYVTGIDENIVWALWPIEAMTGNLNDPGVVVVGDKSVAGVERNVVFNQYATPEFESFVRDVYALAQEGILPLDPDTKVTLEAFDPAVMVQDSMAKRTPGYEKTYGVRYHVYFINDAVQTTAKIYGSMNAISDTSGDPARAMMFLNAMNSQKDLANMVFYGLEGVHYGRNEEGQIDLKMYRAEGEASRYNLTAWSLPGFLSTDPDTTLPIDMVERYEAFSKVLIPADNLGFAFDETQVMTELAAIRSVVAEYMKPLVKGLSDPDVNLPQFLSQLEAAGVGAVLAEEQAQLNAWRQAQGY